VLTLPGLAEDQTPAARVMVPPGARLRRHMHDASDDAIRIERGEHRAIRIERPERSAFERTAGTMEVPPGQAVDCRHDDRARGHQRLHARQHRRDRVRLQSDDDQVLRAKG
jgi:uncharacterized RmlC-like cupin family protein